jgi:hypothetical protein
MRDARLSLSNWLELLVLQAQGLGLRPALRLHRGRRLRVDPAQQDFGLSRDGGGHSHGRILVADDHE